MSNLLLQCDQDSTEGIVYPKSVCMSLLEPQSFHGIGSALEASFQLIIHHSSSCSEGLQYSLLISPATYCGFLMRDTPYDSLHPLLHA